MSQELSDYSDLLAELPSWQTVMVNGRPEVAINREDVERLIAKSPLGEVEARRRLNLAYRDEIAAGRIEAF